MDGNKLCDVMPRKETKKLQGAIKNRSTDFCPVELFSSMTTSVKMLQDENEKFLLDLNGAFSSITDSLWLTASDFQLFPLLKQFLGGNRLESDDEVKTIVLEMLSEPVAELYEDTSFKLRQIVESD